MRILETCIYATDLEAARDFYADTLGLECFLFQPPRQAFFRAGDGVFLVFNPEQTEQAGGLPPHGSRGSVHVCFRAEPDEVDQWERRLGARGHEVFEAEWPGGRSVYVYDPAGNLIEFAPARIWGL